MRECVYTCVYIRVHFILCVKLWEQCCIHHCCIVAEAWKAEETSVTTERQAARLQLRFDQLLKSSQRNQPKKKLPLIWISDVSMLSADGRTTAPFAYLPCISVSIMNVHVSSMAVESRKTLQESSAKKRITPRWRPLKGSCRSSETTDVCTCLWWTIMTARHLINNVTVICRSHGSLSRPQPPNLYF